MEVVAFGPAIIPGALPKRAAMSPATIELNMPARMPCPVYSGPSGANAITPAATLPVIDTIADAVPPDRSPGVKLGLRVVWDISRLFRTGADGPQDVTP
jgi:hypothetical protein